MIKTLFMAFLCCVLLSACSSPDSTTGEPGDDVNNQKITAQIQQLILRCMLPRVYYRWSEETSAQVTWFTTRQAIQVKSSLPGDIQSCVDRYYNAQPFHFRSGLSGKMDIRSS